MSTTIYETDKIQLTQFNGGKERGLMLQLTLKDHPFIDKGYVQLTKEEAVLLSEALHDWGLEPDSKSNEPGKKEYFQACIIMHNFNLSTNELFEIDKQYCFETEPEAFLEEAYRQHNAKQS